MTEDFNLTPPKPTFDQREKLNLDSLESFLYKGHTRQEAAEYFGVHISTISRAAQKIKARQTFPAAAEHRQKIDRKVKSIMKKLEQLNRILTTELQYIQDLINRINERDPQERIRTHGALVRITDALHKNIAQNIEFQKTVYSIAGLHAFIQEVLRVLNSVSPGLRDRVLAELQAKGHIFAALSGLTERPERTLFGDAVNIEGS